MTEPLPADLPLTLASSISARRRLWIPPTVSYPLQQAETTNWRAFCALIRLTGSASLIRSPPKSSTDAVSEATPCARIWHDLILHGATQRQLDGLPVRLSGVDVHRRNCRHRFASVPRLHRTFAVPHLRLSEHALPWQRTWTTESPRPIWIEEAPRGGLALPPCVYDSSPLLNPKRNG